MFPTASQRRDRATTAAAAFAAAEALEGRTLFAVTPDPGATFATAYNTGDLDGAKSYSDAVGPSDNVDIYRFVMPRAGRFFGRLRAYSAPAEIALIQEVHNSDGTVSEIFVDARTADQNGPDGGFASGDLPGRTLSAGVYYLHVQRLSGQTDYLIRMMADYAGQTLGTARDVGSATEDIYKDYVGLFGSPSYDDASDYYKFKMDAPGQFLASFSLETQGDIFDAHLDLIRDANNNGVVDGGEVLESSPSGGGGAVVRDLPAGTYFLRMVNDQAFSNYNLRVNADYAGSSIGTWRNVGPLSTVRTFRDFIHNPIDKMDQYRFTVPGTRPFYAAMSVEGSGTASMSLYRDANNDGKADAAEVVATTGTAGFTQMLTTISGGTYILRATAGSGGGRYSISMEAPPDAAGNSLGSAKNLGALNGLRTGLADYVSPSDKTDYYKFTAAAAGTVTATLAPYLGGNADLALIRDVNGNGVVDGSDVVASSTKTGNQTDMIFKASTAGTYFLRVSHKDGGTSRYIMSVSTDYAGHTPATARDAGILTGGTKTFNDWASQDYGPGSHRDTTDIYKIRLTSAKTLKAVMTGTLSGEDLNLALFRDANNDGVLSAGEQLASSTKLNSPNESITKSLAAGTYFVRVLGVNGDTNYKLTLTV